jgi:hypothetical protein
MSKRAMAIKQEALSIYTYLGIDSSYREVMLNCLIVSTQARGERYIKQIWMILHNKLDSVQYVISEELRFCVRHTLNNNYKYFILYLYYSQVWCRIFNYQNKCKMLDCSKLWSYYKWTKYCGIYNQILVDITHKNISRSDFLSDWWDISVPATLLSIVSSLYTYSIVNCIFIREVLWFNHNRTTSLSCIPCLGIKE